MEYEVEETGELTRTANVTVPKEDFEGRINKRLRELSKDVDLDGFRKGNVPMDVMRQRYGPQVTQEVVEELVNDSVNELIEDMGQVLHLGTPEVTAVPMQGDDKLAFSIDAELRPDIDPVGYLGIEVEKPTVEIDGEAIDQELEALRHEHADTKPVALRTEIATGDIVTVDFEALDDRPELEPMQGDDIQIEIGAGQALPGIDEALEGAETDATVESNVELGQNFPAEELRGEEVEVRLDVKKVETKVLPQVDDDFAVQTGQGDTLLELRGNIRDRLEEQRNEQANQIAHEDLVDALLEQNDFDLPPNFVEQQLDKTAEQRLQMLSQQGLDPDEIDLDTDALKEQMRDDVIRQIKSEFILMEIAQKENIQVEESDLHEFFDEQAEQMGINVQQYMSFMRQNEDMMRQANATVLLDKIKSHLLSEADITDVDWPEPEQQGPGVDIAEAADDDSEDDSDDK